jgi:hypothetical protein
VKQQYTLDEIHRYQEDLAITESRIVLRNLPDKETYDHCNAQVHVMREVILRMHESVLKHGPMRPSLLSRLLAAREIRKLGQQISGVPTGPLDFTGSTGNAIPVLPPRKQNKDGFKRNVS